MRITAYVVGESLDGSIVVVWIVVVVVVISKQVGVKHSVFVLSQPIVALWTNNFLGLVVPLYCYNAKCPDSETNRLTNLLDIK